MSQSRKVPPSLLSNSKIFSPPKKRNPHNHCQFLSPPPAHTWEPCTYLLSILIFLFWTVPMNCGISLWLLSLYTYHCFTVLTESFSPKWTQRTISWETFCYFHFLLTVNYATENGGHTCFCLDNCFQFQVWRKMFSKGLYHFILTSAKYESCNFSHL